MNYSKFAPEGKGVRLMTGPAALYWNDSNVGKGDYAVKATFAEGKQTYNHPHPFGVFIGGQALDSGTPTALYCVAYRNGNYIVRGFSAGKRFDIVGKPVPHEAVKTAASADAEVGQEVGWTVRGDSLACTVNGVAVWSGTRADVTGAGKLTSTDGIAGIRVSQFGRYRDRVRRDEVTRPRPALRGSADRNSPSAETCRRGRCSPSMR